MDVTPLYRCGWSIEQIAAEVGRPPQTVSKRIRQGGPPQKRATTMPPRIDGRWQQRIGELLASYAVHALRHDPRHRECVRR